MPGGQDDADEDSEPIHTLSAPPSEPGDAAVSELSAARRTARALCGLRHAWDDHAAGGCGDKVVGFAVSPIDLVRLQIVEVWGVPVLAAESVTPGVVKLLCQANGVLSKHYMTVEELLEDWRL